MRLSMLHASRASACWLSGCRALSRLPRSCLYRKKVFSARAWLWYRASFFHCPRPTRQMRLTVRFRARGCFPHPLLVSGAGESHPRALPEPCVNVSAHTAPITQLFTVPLPIASGQTTPVVSERLHGASGLLGVGVDIACISSEPTVPGVDSDN